MKILDFIERLRAIYHAEGNIQVVLKSKYPKVKLYLVSEFDEFYCSSIKGNGLILTNNNEAYFVIGDKLVKKNNILYYATNINRYDIVPAKDKIPLSYRRSLAIKKKIIKDAMIKCHYIPKISEVILDFNVEIFDRKTAELKKIDRVLTIGANL